MGYSLGVDLGTTFVAAAVAHASRVEMFTLGDRSVVSPAAVYARDDGELVTGDAAVRRAVSNPDRVSREFKRRLGDPTPVILGGSAFPVSMLLGVVLRDVVARVAGTEGQAPDRLVLTHPANWGPYRRELFDEVPEAAELTTGDITVQRAVTEPEAAAAHYAASRSLGEGDTVAVYDLGGGTFDATVLRKRADGIEILGTPEGIERLGGVDFDEAILSFVNFQAGGALTELDLGDSQTSVAMARLRQDCVLAKEALSVDTETTIPVFLPQRHFDVRLTLSEFENMIRAQIESTIGALTRTLQSARVEPDDLSAVLLVGGSSRIPLVARMLSDALGRPIVIDTHPKYAVALGAAELARENGEEAAGQPSANGHAVGVSAHGAPDPGARGAAAPPSGSAGSGSRRRAAPSVPPGSGSPRSAGAPAAAGGDLSRTAGQDDAAAAGGLPRPAGEAGTSQAPAGLPRPPEGGPTGLPRRPEDDPAGLPRPPGGGSGGLPRPSEAGSAGLPRPPGTGSGPGGGPRPPATGSGGGTAIGAATAATAAAAASPGTRSRGGAAQPAGQQPTGPAAHPAGQGATGPAAQSAGQGPTGAAAPPGSAGSSTSAGTFGPGWSGSSAGTFGTAGTTPSGSAPPGSAPPTGGAHRGRTVPAGTSAGSPGDGPSSTRAWATSSSDPAPGRPGGADTTEPPDTVGGSGGAAPPPARPPAAGWPSSDGRRRSPLLAVAVVAVLALAAGVVAFLTGGYGLFTGDGIAQPDATAPPSEEGVAVAVPIPTLGEVVPAGPTSGFVAVSPNGRLAYVANRAAGVVTVIDTSVDRVTATIEVPAGPPQYLAFAPDGAHVYVSVFDEARTIAAVAVLDTTTNSVVATVPVQTRPFALAVTPDGSKVYVPNHDSGTVSVIETATNEVTQEIRVARNPHWVAISPDGTRLYTANHESNVISVLATSDDRVLAEIPVGTSPHSVAVNPSRPLVANVNYDAASVSFTDTASNTVVATVPVGINPQAIAWSPDGRFAYTANVTEDTVSVISADTYTVTATLPVGDGPTSIAVLPNGTQAYVSNLNDGTLTVLDIGSR
ncbi:Hsp70 family protein [Pseudonocardia parietis]|uniref:YVTN family beta-propeller protein n=1 Tax=Pseudonocardia parietis TaxID=570936 RepID=A0ABS4VNR2_9PSEU|nr:Hsp70 family protein [Pseudonocardia parietis]MBP2365571.1 YVTN family beta-propeller protein [Pseudonocardia parietis]